MLQRNLALFVFLALSGLTIGTAFADSPTPPEKDVLIFMNGDQLSGHFESAAGGNVVFKSDMAGTITIGWDKIKELRTAGHYAVLEKGFKGKGLHDLNTAKIPQGTVTMADQTLAVKSDGGTVESVPAKDADFVIDSASYEKTLHGKTGLLTGWNGGVTAGATLVKATQNSQTYTLGLGLTRTVPSVAWLNPRYRDIINVLETYGKVTQPGVDTIKSSIFHADGEHDIYFSPRAYALANVSFDHNYSQGLGLQQIYGAGVGMTLLKKPNQQLDVKAQAQYESQTFFIVPPATAVTSDQHLIGATLAENYMRKLKGVTLNEQLQYLPAFNDEHDYSAVGQVGAVFPVYKRFSFTANVLDTYLNDATVGSKRNSFQFVTGVSYKFR